MSGHSKWAKIHRQKAIADAKRGTAFTRLANAISIAAKSGGGDPEMNFKLKLAIDKAKESNMPKENIERAVKKGTGELGDKKIEQIMYEGFGPAGTLFLVDVLTDNRNRSSSELKHLFSEYGGNLGGPNSVLWQFENAGVIGLKKGTAVNEAMELELIDNGAQDIQREEDMTTIYCGHDYLEKIKKFLESKKISLEFADIEMIGKNKIAVEDRVSKEKIEKIISELENNEDVNNYFTNADL